MGLHCKFIDNIDGIVLSSSSQVYKNVIAGEYAVGVSYEDPVVQAIIDNKDNPTLTCRWCTPKRVPCGCPPVSPS